MRKLNNGVYWNWLLVKHSWMVVVMVQSTNLLNKHQWSNYLQIICDYILFHSPTYKYGRNDIKKKWVLFKQLKQFKQFKKLILLKNIYSRTQLLNTSKIQNILPKMKTYSLSIKIGLPGKRTFKSSLCVLLPNFIRSEPFDTQNEDISLPNQSTLHLDHKCLC